MDKIFNANFVINRVVKTHVLTPDIAMVHVKDTWQGKDIVDKFCYYKPSNVSDWQQFCIQKDDNYNNLVFMKKEFLKDYATNAHPSDLEFFVDKYGIPIKTLWQSLSRKDLDISDYIPVEVSYYDNTIYPFKYGVSRQGWFPHMVPYSQACYMVTNNEYDLNKLLSFLLTCEDNNEVVIRRDKFSDSDICWIPGYNRDISNATHYINFLCLVNTEEEYNSIRNGGIMGVNKKWKKLIEPFELEENAGEWGD